MHRDGDDQKWWTALDPAVQGLARRICLAHGMPAEAMVLPYAPSVLTVPNGNATPVREADLVPLWSCYAAVARLALEQRDAQDVEATTGVPAASREDTDKFDDILKASAAAAVPGDRHAIWRKEAGLDAPSKS